MIKSILSRLQPYISPDKKQREYPNIHDSKVQKPHLVSEKAIIKNSVVWGDVIVNDYVKITESQVLGSVEIGSYSSVNGPFTDMMSRINSIKIGKFCAIARKVTIQEYNHFSNRCSIFYMNGNIFGGSDRDDITSRGDIYVGNDVWIGANSTILSGANISNGAIVGAGSVVTDFVPPYAIVGGVPAKVIKYRFGQDLTDKLLELCWWDWPLERIIANKDLFTGELTIQKIDQVLA